jgi:hypothetical protein
VTMSDVYRGMYPFVALQLVGLGLCIYYPSIILFYNRHWREIADTQYATGMNAMQHRAKRLNTGSPYVRRPRWAATPAR